MKVFRSFSLLILISLLFRFILSSCVSQSLKAHEPTPDEVSDQANIDGVVVTNLNKEYGLKEFVVCEIRSDNGNTYNFLKFKSSDVANRKDNNYYSRSPILADMSVTILEGENFEKNTMEEVLAVVTSYISNTIESKYEECEDKAYLFIKYNIFEEEKHKLVVCEKKSTGYVIHDLSYFVNGEKEDIKLAEDYMEDMSIMFDFTLDNLFG